MSERLSSESDQTLDGLAIFPLVYDEMRSIATKLLNCESPGNTLQPTALVHEAFFRLIGDADPKTITFDNLGHFFASASIAMRRILIESARRKARLKHGGNFHREDIDPDSLAQAEKSEELLVLNEALNKLAASDPSLAELVCLRYFGGLTLKEIATTLGIAPRTADLRWSYARAWLLAEMGRQLA